MAMANSQPAVPSHFRHKKVRQTRAMPNVAGYPTFRQVAWGGSFEGYTTVGLGVRTRLPFRVFRSTNHLVIDVAHHW